MRQLTAHKANGLNEVITIQVIDQPGAGGTNHIYEISGAGRRLRIEFQNGPILEAGLNGISNEALLAVVIDRLEGFQSGKFKCKDNEDALGMVKGGLTCLLKRTRKRTDQGAEGTNVPHVERPPEIPNGEPAGRIKLPVVNGSGHVTKPSLDSAASTGAELARKKFIWITQGGDDEHGLFDTVEAAVADARDEATAREQGIPIAVFNCRPATAADAALFEDDEDDAGDLIDVIKPDWFVGKWVPEDIALLQTVVPMPKPAAPAVVAPVAETVESQVDTAAAPMEPAEPKAPFGG